MNTDGHRYFRPSTWTFALLIAAISALVLSGCATNGGAQPGAPASNIQSTSGPTVSGYIDAGGGKTLH
jgi:hypothetical protein